MDSLPKAAKKQKEAVSFGSEVFLVKAGAARVLEWPEKGQVIFSQGGRANAVFYIQAGKVKLAVLSAQGKEAVVAILDVGDFLGEECMASQFIRMATATSMGPGSVLRIPRKEMIRMLHEEPGVSDFFARHVLSRSIRVQEDLVDQLFNSSEKRLARALLLLSNYGKEDSPEKISPEINQETLAEMVGTTRSRVNVFMNKFKKLGFIDYKNGLQVHRSLLNILLHE